MGKVTSKTDLRDLNKTQKFGHFFGITISDGDSIIYIAFFNDMAIDYFG